MPSTVKPESKQYDASASSSACEHFLDWGQRVQAHRVLSFILSIWPLLLLVAVSAGAYATYGILRYNHFIAAGYDLGIFDQAMWHYSRFEAPASTVREVSNLLGDHFHPILLLLVPTYWIWSDARVLVIDQAILIAASVIPVYLFARPRIGQIGAYLLGITYVLFWGIEAAVVFDFHEVAFAPLLIALGVLFTDKKKWSYYYVTLAALLLVKEDMVLVAVGFAGVLALQKQWRPALISLAGGVGAYLVATKIVIPLFDGNPSQYWTYTKLGSSLPDVIYNTIRAPGLPFSVFSEGIDHKAQTIAYLLLPFLGLVLYSPLVIIAVILILERMLSSNTNYWIIHFHYSLAIAPILAMGAADGLRNLLNFFKVQQVYKRTLVTVIATGCMVIGSLLLMQTLPLAKITKPSFYQAARRQSNFNQALTYIPAGASVMAQDFFIPHISHRDEIYEVRPQTPQTDFIITSLGTKIWFPVDSMKEFNAIINQHLQDGAYEVVYQSGGIVVLRRIGEQGPGKGRPIKDLRQLDVPPAMQTWQK